MARLIYATNVSVDGFTEDADGALDWAPADDDVFEAITALMGSAGTYLYGRRMYETLAGWETDPTVAQRSDLTARYAQVWQAAEKVVYSSSLTAPITARARLERHFDPSAIRELKAASGTDLLIGGPNLAAQAMTAGLVDDVELYVWPFILGGRKPALPAGFSAELALVDEHRFDNGVMRLRYRILRR